MSNKALQGDFGFRADAEFRLVPHADAVFLLDDVTFYRDLPDSLRGTVLEP